MKISPKLSRAFQVANLLAIVLVIMIHYNSRGEIADKSLANANYVVQEYLANGVSRVGVPLFAFASGFFFFLNYAGISSYVRNLKKRVRTLFVPYILVSAVMTIGFFTVRAVVRGNYNIRALDVIAEIIGRPRPFQFWFLRDLMVLVLVSPAILILTRKLRELWIVILAAGWLFEVQLFPKVTGVYLLNIETLFFFSLGCYFVTHVGALERLVSLRKSWLGVVALVWLGLIAVRVWLDPTMDLWYVRKFTTGSLLLYKVAILVGLAALIRLSAIEAFNTRRALYLSGYTFFAFMFHSFPLNFLLWRISTTVAPAQYAFYLSFPLAAVIVFLAAFICERYLNPVYRVVAGDRGPRKALERQAAGGFAGS